MSSADKGRLYVGPAYYGDGCDGSGAAAVVGVCRYVSTWLLFSQTGHRVGGNFLLYWQSHGGLPQQGYPISDEFTETSPLDNKSYLVQYFERAVFEAHPENAAPYDILLSQLGTFRVKQKYPAGPPTPSASPFPGGGGTGTGTGGTGGVPASTLPAAGSSKPVPPTNTYVGCPSTGDGGDQTLNIRKNRTDTPQSWYPVTEQAALSLHYPQSIDKRPRSSWSAADSAEIARYEGLPLQIEGYLAGAKAEGPESPNCHSVTDADNHLWLVDDPSKDRSQSIVSEVTPRVRALHTGWSIGNISSLVTSRTKVRISGWLMMDQEHPEQLGATRATLWEIHPIIGFDVWQNGTWVPLGGGSSTGGGGGGVAGGSGGGQPQPSPVVTQAPVGGGGGGGSGGNGGAYQASASVSNAAPSRNTQVTVTGRLMQGNQPVVGAQMATQWHYKSATSLCQGQTSSAGEASCTRDIGGASVGYPVTIDVNFTAPDGTHVSTQTSFTPH